MATPSDYIRLPGFGNALPEGRLAYRHRAYLASDHILLVRRARYGESYRRLYLDDIQAVFYAETDDARSFAVATFAGAICAAGLAAVFAQSPLGAAAVGTVICGAVAVILVLALVINLLRGATARCWIRTSNGAAQVPNIGRLRVARRFAQAIEDAVAMRQGIVDRDRVDDHLSDLHAPLAGDGAIQPDRIPHTSALPWLLLLVEAGYAGLTMVAPGVFPPGVWILFTVAACAAVLMTLLRGRDKRWSFAYRALISTASFYTTAKSLHWGLYWFLLSMEQIVIFEIARSDLLILGGATVVINGLLAVLGFVIPPGPSRPAIAAPETDTAPGQGEL